MELPPPPTVNITLHSYCSKQAHFPRTEKFSKKLIINMVVDVLSRSYFRIASIGFHIKHKGGELTPITPTKTYPSHALIFCHFCFLKLGNYDDCTVYCFMVYSWYVVATRRSELTSCFVVIAPPHPSNMILMRSLS